MTHINAPASPFPPLNYYFSQTTFNAVTTRTPFSGHRFLVDAPDQEKFYWSTPPLHLDP